MVRGETDMEKNYFGTI